MTHFLGEETYDLERADEFAWRSRRVGMFRWDYLRMLIVGGAALSAFSFENKIAFAQKDEAILKNAPDEFFIRNGSNLEMRWEAMYNRGYIVPTEVFFVRNNSPVVPRIDKALWRPPVQGHRVCRPPSLPYDRGFNIPS